MTNATANICINFSHISVSTEKVPLTVSISIVGSCHLRDFLD